MALITFSDIRGRAQSKQRYAKALMEKTASAVLEEQARSYPMGKKFSVFLSHSYRDAHLDDTDILNLKAYLEEFGLTVYVDWIIDWDLPRDAVNVQTANRLRIRMRNSDTLFFVTSQNSSDSKWMPWELGYMDGLGKPIAIMPITNQEDRDWYLGQEYLQLYPYADIAEIGNSNQLTIWINEDEDTYVRYDKWVEGEKPKRRS
jgi:hypothetical protein